MKFDRKDSDMSQNDALVYGTGIFFMTTVSGMSCSHILFKGICVGTKVRVAVTNLIYQKVCRCAVYHQINAILL